MRLLKVTEKEHPQLDEFFDETVRKGVDEVAPEVINGKKSVRMNGETAEEYDAAFFEVPERNPVFGRVMIKMVEEKNVTVNYPAIAFFIMSKKNYLAYVLQEKGIQTPPKVVAASEKASRNVMKHLDLPVIAKKYTDNQLSESSKLENSDEVEEFASGTEYGAEVIVFERYVEGDKYKIFYGGGDIISLRDKTDGWRISEDNLHYSNLSSDIKEEVKKTVKGIGTECAELTVRRDNIVGVSPNPDLQLYTDISGKNAYESMAEILKE